MPTYLFNHNKTLVHLGEPTVRLRHVFSTWTSALVLSALAFSLVAFAGPAGAAGALTMTVGAGAAVPAQPVVVTWSFKNTTGKPLFGTVVYGMNGAALTSGGTINTSSVQAGKVLSGTYTVIPGPGVSTVTVTMINTTMEKVPDTSSNKPPTKLDPSQPTPAPKAPATKTVPVQTVVAQGSAQINASAPNPLIGATLTDAQRVQIMKDYAPLLLYSYDHDSDEKYSPIDIMTFAKGSTLDGPADPPALTNPAVLLDPTGTKATGTISSSQPVLPVPYYVHPSQGVENGTDWATVMSNHASGKDIGLYARAVLVDVSSLQDDADTTLKARLMKRYNCKLFVACAPVIKIEYWQFYGYSHDYDGAKFIEGYTDHAGDWCSVQLYVDPSWWLSSRSDRAILAVYHYLHGKQAGFDMSLGSRSIAPVNVPSRGSGGKGPTFPAYQYGGPNGKYSPAFSIKAKGVWLPVGGPNEGVQEAEAKNNTLQLAADTSSDSSGSTPSQAEFRHPVAYVEWGGHEFWPTPNWKIYGASKHNGTGQYAYFGNGFTDLGDKDGVAPDPTASDEVNLVRWFAGYWGTNNGSGPPQSPSLHKEWYWNLGTDCPRVPYPKTVSQACSNERLLLKEIETVPSRPY